MMLVGIPSVNMDSATVFKKANNPIGHRLTISHLQEKGSPDGPPISLAKTNITEIAVNRHPSNQYLSRSNFEKSCGKMAEVPESYMLIVTEALEKEQASEKFIASTAEHLRTTRAIEMFVASIAHALNSENIPCVLWGHFLLNVHGVPSITSSIDFVIPDDCLEVGIKTLTQLETLTPCTLGEACLSSSQMRYTPSPAFHIHTKDSTLTVDLFPQSETLWFLPPLDSSLCTPRNLKLPSPFLLASDYSVLPICRPGRGEGAFKSEQDLVIVPKAHILLEAFMRLYARDQGTRAGSFAVSMIMYIWGYVDNDGFLDIAQLPQPFKTLYEELKQGTKPLRKFLDELREALGVPEPQEETWVKRDGY